MTATAAPIVRMRCGPEHSRLYRIPAGYTVDWAGVAPWVYGADGAELRCRVPDCKPRAMRAVRGLGRVAAAVPCRRRCVDATRADCECECGGANHGAGEYSPKVPIDT